MADPDYADSPRSRPGRDCIGSLSWGSLFDLHSHANARQEVDTDTYPLQFGSPTTHIPHNSDSSGYRFSRIRPLNPSNENGLDPIVSCLEILSLISRITGGGQWKVGSGGASSPLRCLRADELGRVIALGDGEASMVTGVTHPNIYTHVAKI